MDGGSVPDRLAPVHQTKPVGSFEQLLMIKTRKTKTNMNIVIKNIICAKTWAFSDVPIQHACWHCTWCEVGSR